MKVFYFFYLFIILQRLSELVVAKNNEKWLKGRGAYEYGQKHYPLMILIHTLFFISLLLEVINRNLSLSPVWPFILSLFFLTQIIRIWALSSLGRFWNTKIIILPGAQLVKKGPYKFMKHPNYMVVTMEFILIPFLFQAYLTMILFSILNAVILSIRIPEEEKALTAYIIK